MKYVKEAVTAVFMLTLFLGAIALFLWLFIQFAKYSNDYGN